MNRSRLLFLLSAAFLASGLVFLPALRPGTASASPAVISAEALDTLIGVIKKQQEQMAANQTKIETQTAALKEELRQAKIYSARGGAANRR